MGSVFLENASVRSEESAKDLSARGARRCGQRQSLTIRKSTLCRRPVVERAREHAREEKKWAQYP
jgi:hypothetical protein